MLLGSGLSAGVNFLGSIIVTKILSFEVFGLWLSLRSFVQISSILNLGINNYLLVKVKPPFENQRILINEINTIAFFLVALFTSLMSLGFLLYYSKTNYFELFFPFVIFGVCLVLAGISSLNVRALRNGQKLFVGNLLDACVGFISLIIIWFFPDITYFIYFQAFRFFVKFIYQFDFTSYKFTLVNFRRFAYFLSISFPIHFRSWIQSVAQYGDKFILPLIFGFTLAGAIGFGSTLALPIVMVISATSVILIPRTIDLKNDDKILASIYKNEVKQVINLAIILSFLIPLFTIILDLENKLEIITGFWMTVFINMSQFVSLWYFKENKTAKSALILVGLVSIYFAVIFLVGLIPHSIQPYILYNCLLLVFIIVSFLSFKLIISINLSAHFIYSLIAICFVQLLIKLDFSLVFLLTLIITLFLSRILFKKYLRRAIDYLKIMLKF